MIHTPKSALWVSAGIISFLLASFLYIQFFQSPLLSRKEFLLALILFLALIPVLFLLLSRFLLPALRSLSKRSRWVWLILSGLVGIFFLFVSIQPHNFYLLLPRRSLAVDIPAAPSERTITLQWFKTALGDVSFDQLQAEGSWQRTDAGLTYSGSQPASLAWQGRAGDSAELVFAKTDQSTPITLSWEGQNQSVNLADSDSATVSVSQTFPRALPGQFLTLFLTWFAAAFLFLLLTLFLSSVQLKRAPAGKRGRASWLLYTLPMIAVWSISLLTFFPGIVTPDGTNQWNQIITGQFNDALPVMHTLLVMLITRLWFSPAAVILVQILTLSLTVAWGIDLLDGQGLPRWAGWGLATLFALSPVNNNLVVTLWKDIPYSTCLLLLSLLTLKVVLSRGEWLARRAAWVWFALVSLGIAVFRLNGLPVPFVTLVVLAIVYRTHWKPILAALVVYLGLFALIQGPLYDQLKVDRMVGFKQLIFMHHIAAHVVTGGPLTAEEGAMAARVLPLDEWTYDCCTNIKIWRADSYDEKRFGAEADTIHRLLISLALKEPGVEWNHMVCVSSLIWELPSRCKLNHEAPPTGSPTWITPNDLGLRETSLLPALVMPLTWMQWWVNQSPQDILFYTPAVFLYLGLFCTLLYVFRGRNWKRTLFILPAVVQSGVMLIINVSRDFRYQYGVYLIGLFSLGLLILALTEPRRISARPEIADRKQGAQND